MDRNKSGNANSSDALDQPDEGLPVTGQVPSADNVSATGDDETIDGLNESDEAVRSGAEDIPASERQRRRLPVFERGEELPKTD